jgi:hypothetical protein
MKTSLGRLAHGFFCLILCDSKYFRRVGVDTLNPTATEVDLANGVVKIRFSRNGCSSSLCAIYYIDKMGRKTMQLNGFFCMAPIFILMVPFPTIQHKPILFLALYVDLFFL